MHGCSKGTRPYSHPLILGLPHYLVYHDKKTSLAASTPSKNLLASCASSAECGDDRK